MSKIEQKHFFYLLTANTVTVKLSCSCHPLMKCNVDLHPESQTPPPPPSIDSSTINNAATDNQWAAPIPASLRSSTDAALVPTEGLAWWNGSQSLWCCMLLQSATSSTQRKRGVLTQWGPQTGVAGLQSMVAALICQDDGDFVARGTRPFIKPPRHENVQTETNVEIRERWIATRRWWQLRGIWNISGILASLLWKENEHWCMFPPTAAVQIFRGGFKKISSSRWHFFKA